jgi:hypothetical protein
VLRFGKCPHTAIVASTGRKAFRNAGEWKKGANGFHIGDLPRIIQLAYFGPFRSIPYVYQHLLGICLAKARDYEQGTNDHGRQDSQFSHMLALLFTPHLLMLQTYVLSVARITVSADYIT